jgi:hypothetical protein
LPGSGSKLSRIRLTHKLNISDGPSQGYSAVFPARHTAAPTERGGLS